jgi:hypothetical protein
MILLVDIMEPRKTTPLTNRDLYEKLENIQTQLHHIQSDTSFLPIHIYLSIVIIGTFAAISFTYLFDDVLFLYLSIVGIILVICLLVFLLIQRKK